MFKVIKGTFHVKGFQPDGDGIASRPMASRWNGFKWVEGPSARNRSCNCASSVVRRARNHRQHHQPRSFAIGALEELLELLGIGAVYSISVRTIVTADDGSRASSPLPKSTRSTGRSASSSRPTRHTDGAELESGRAIEQSVNYLMCRDGMVCPTFYTTTAPKSSKNSRSRREARGPARLLDDRPDEPLLLLRHPHHP